jgi:uncharacterized membrane protein
MTLLSLTHLLAAVIAVITGVTIMSLRKGDRRHRVLGWVYVACMAVSLVTIVIRTISRPAPFAGYAVMTLGVLGAAVVAARQKPRQAAWRSWHAALMSLTMLGSAMAIGSILGGIVVGAGNGPAFYRMFNVVIACFTVAGLWIINTRRVIWGSAAGPLERQVRVRFGGLVIASSALLIVANWLHVRDAVTPDSQAGRIDPPTHAAAR